jgi:outer membrane protein OmpA-like peptidoglycan-associated protein
MQGKDPFLVFLGLFILGGTFFFCGKGTVTSPPPVALQNPSETSPPVQKLIEPTPVTQVSTAAVLKKKIDELLVGTAMMFRINSALLVPEGKTVLNSVAAILQEDPASVFEVAGHTDGVGPEHANRLLSEQRAKAVVEYLISKGIVADRLIVAGYGASQPITDSSTNEAREPHQQIEFSIGTKGEEP